MLADNPLDNGETHLCSLKCVSAVDALKYSEELVVITHIESRSIIPDAVGSQNRLDGFRILIKACHRLEALALILWAIHMSKPAIAIDRIANSSYCLTFLRKGSRAYPKKYPPDDMEMDHIAAPAAFKKKNRLIFMGLHIPIPKGVIILIP